MLSECFFLQTTLVFFECAYDLEPWKRSFNGPVYTLIISTRFVYRFGHEENNTNDATITVKALDQDNGKGSRVFFNHKFDGCVMTWINQQMTTHADTMWIFFISNCPISRYVCLVFCFGGNFIGKHSIWKHHQCFRDLDYSGNWYN